MELTTIKRALISAACFVLVQPNHKSSGVRIIPPPMPSIPERRPIEAPDRYKIHVLGAKSFVVHCAINLKIAKQEEQE